MKLLLPAAALLLVAAAPAPAPSPAIRAALADPARPAEDTAKDAARRPGDVLAFARIKPGQKVGDFVMGGGYFTRILAKAVGPKGKVYAFQPDEFVTYKASYATDQDKVAAAYPNVTPLRSAFAAPGFPKGLDAIVTVQNYHDLHLKPFAADTAARANAILYAALKPGGVLVVIDHVAATGSGLDAADKLHRIDPAIARVEIEKAGFRFDGESAILRDPADPHTASVFDSSIRGKTDQFAYRFVRPR